MCHGVIQKITPAQILWDTVTINFNYYVDSVKDMFNSAYLQTYNTRYHIFTHSSVLGVLVALTKAT